MNRKTITLTFTETLEDQALLDALAKRLQRSTAHLGPGRPNTC